MPRVTDTRRQIIDAAYGLFYKGGFARTSLDAVADAVGVTKKTFYYHFDSKNTLIAAVLEAQHDLAISRTQRWLDQASGDPVAMVESLFSEYGAWAKQPRWRGSGFTRAVMEYADSPGHPARTAARRHKAATENLLAERFAQYGVKRSRRFAQCLMLLIEGCNSILLTQGDADYVEAAREAAQALLKQHRV